MKRLSALDYLRGLAAFGVMVFHYSMWTRGLFSAGDFLGRVGIYAVSVFYVLSGLTLYHVYYHKIGAPSAAGLIDFGVKRVFRIFPLLWLATGVTLLYTHEVYTRKTIFLNFTGLFSVYKWDETVAYGAWSIGNELAFYLFFPVLVWLAKKSRAALLAFCGAIVAVFLWFAFVHFNPAHLLAGYWHDYTSPLNQVFFFAGGFMAGLLAPSIPLRGWVALLLAAACVATFIYLPATDDSVFLITGVRRVVFSAICVIFCFCAYKKGFSLPGLLGRAFGVLGEISYSVYLLHPIVWNLTGILLKRYSINLTPAWRLGSGFVATVIVACIVYQIYEKAFMNIGRKASRALLARMAPAVAVRQ